MIVRVPRPAFSTAPGIDHEIAEHLRQNDGVAPDRRQGGDTRRDQKADCLTVLQQPGRFLDYPGKADGFDPAFGSAEALVVLKNLLDMVGLIADHGKVGPYRIMAGTQWFRLAVPAAAWMKHDDEKIMRQNARSAAA